MQNVSHSELNTEILDTYKPRTSSKNTFQTLALFLSLTLSVSVHKKHSTVSPHAFRVHREIKLLSVQSVTCSQYVHVCFLSPAKNMSVYV